MVRLAGMLLDRGPTNVPLVLPAAELGRNPDLERAAERCPIVRANVKPRYGSFLCL